MKPRRPARASELVPQVFPRRMACSHCPVEEFAVSLEDMAAKLQEGGGCPACRRWICKRCYGRPPVREPVSHLLN